MGDRLHWTFRTNETDSTYLFTKLVEARSVKAAIVGATTKFLFELVFCRFGCPFLTSNQGTHFTANVINNLMQIFNVIHHKSIPYYPRENGQVESTNKILVFVLIKVRDMKRLDCTEVYMQHHGPITLHGGQD